VGLIKAVSLYSECDPGMTSSTELYLPINLPYPIKIVSLALSPSESIERGTNLLNYSYTYIPPDDKEPPEVRYGTWESPIEGTIDNWKLRPGDHVSARRANEKPILLVTEPCKHGVQLSGLCCLCGKDMTA
jgi:RNA polymerase II subunit A C-terminal domain phosphatase